MLCKYCLDCKCSPVRVLCLRCTITPVTSEFESTSDNQALKEVIVARIEREGGISFHDFMAMALYQPRLGYYCSPGEKMGRLGDYLTSPEISPVFGAMVGRQLREMWEAMERPARFKVVEVGAGNGTLCRDVLRWARRSAPELLTTIEYGIVEISQAMVVRQRDSLVTEGLDEHVTWHERLPDEIEGCILTNELLDAMPVHVVVAEGAAVREVFVTWDRQSFGENLRAPSTAGVERHFENLGLRPGEQCRAEVNLQSLNWMRDAAAALRRGFVLTFDYGYEATELYAPWRKDGTLLCFYRHNPSNDPYARIGRQDMTSHVDFTSLRQTGEQAGLETIGLVTQSAFLTDVGIAAALMQGDEDLEGHYTRRRAVTELLDPAGLGRIRVLAQSNGMGSVKLSGMNQQHDA